MEAAVLNPQLKDGIHCPDCGYFFSTVAARGGNYAVRRCPKCGRRFD